jgi:Mg2+-importing ATPase
MEQAPLLFNANLHSHWFLMSLVTQTVIIYLLRTAKIPFLQSTPSKPVFYSTTAIMAIGIALPYIPGLSTAFGFVHPAPSFYGFLTAAALAYCLEVHLLKMLYVKIFKKWL